LRLETALYEQLRLDNGGAAHSSIAATSGNSTSV
jgi:hypothetical protein